MILRKFWTPAERSQLRQLYPDTPSEDAARALGRSVSAIYSQAGLMGLTKSAAYQANAARRMAQRRPGTATEFRPGFTPWNKGMKGLQIGGMATQFQPGHLGGNAAKRYQPIGAERISKEGYLERKINDSDPLTQRRWRAVHLIQWESENGPLPPGHALVFRDGNKRNFAPENLELITRAELMRRNTIHRLPKEIVGLLHLNARLKRAIRNQERHQEQPHE